jgi:hypothetical protein
MKEYEYIIKEGKPSRVECDGNKIIIFKSNPNGIIINQKKTTKEISKNSTGQN